MFDDFRLLGDISKLIAEYKHKTGADVFMTVRLDNDQYRFDKIGFVRVDEINDCVKSGDYFIVRDDGFVCSRAMDSFRIVSS